MRGPWHVGVAAAILSRRPTGERRALADGLRVSQKQIVQVIVRPDNREGCYGRRKNYLVASCTKFNIASEKAPHFCGRFVTSMSNSQVTRCQPGLCHFAADPYQRHQPELDLMPL